MLPQARAAWMEAAEQLVGNPSSLHRAGAKAEAAMEEARRDLAKVLGCSSAQIIWTSGATESNNIVLNHIRRSNPGEIWISAIEHPSVLAPAQQFGNVALIPVTPEGIIELQWIEERLKKNSRPALLAVMAVNNETGVVQPWKQVQELCLKFEVPYLCDATQWIGKKPGAGLGQISFVSGCAHKFGGPKGIGFLKVPSLEINPLVRGGEQESGVRAGTENVTGIISMAAALKAAENLADPQHAQWRDHFEEELLSRIPGVKILGAGMERIWNTSAVLMPSHNCKARWVVKLDRYGFAVSTGSACASGKEKPSHVLSAMNVSSEQAAHALRFSSGWDTKEKDWKNLLECLCKIAADEMV